MTREAAFGFWQHKKGGGKGNLYRLSSRTVLIYMFTYEIYSLMHFVLIDLLIYYEEDFIAPKNIEHPAFLHPSGFHLRQSHFNSVSRG